MDVKLSRIKYLRKRNASIHDICHHVPEALGGIVRFCHFFCFYLLPWNWSIPRRDFLFSLGPGIKRHMEQGQMESSRDTASAANLQPPICNVLCCCKLLGFGGYLWMQQSKLICHLIRNIRNGFCEWEMKFIGLNHVRFMSFLLQL